MSGSPSGMVPIAQMMMPQIGQASGNPYETKLGGGSGKGITIPTVQYQQPKGQNNGQQPVPMTTPGQAFGQVGQNLPGQVQQAMNLYQQRFGNQSQNLPMNSNAGGVWAGNPNQLQVGPETPTTPQAPATNPGVATDSPAIDSANANNTSLAQGPTSGQIGGGIASALGSVSKAFGQESETDAKLAANPPKPTVTGQPFANFMFTPMFGGGGLS